MFRQIGLLAVAVAMFSIAGGHWAVLQSVAWVQMLVSYSQASGSLGLAVDQTFDGQHPCALCQEIQAAKAREHKGSPATSTANEDAKVKAVAADSLVCFAERRVSKTMFPVTAEPCARSLDVAPPTPPPRQRGLAA